MRNTWTIIQREYLERVRTRAFLISTVLVPLFMFAAVVLPARFMSDEEGIETMKAWLNAKFEGGRHERRVEKIDPPDALSGTA